MRHHNIADPTQQPAESEALSSPHPLFDPHWYAQQNPDLPPEQATFGHYLTEGWRNLKSPHPLFSVEYYFEQRPDVKAAGLEPLTHFITRGWKEGTNPNRQFDVAAYLAQGPELGDKDPLTHYVDRAGNDAKARPQNLVSVIIPVHNRIDLTIPCLDSIYRYQTDDLPIEIIVIDDASTDDTAQIVRERYPEIKLIQNARRQTFGANMNAAAKLARVV